jgi:hypothetical protein
LVTGNEALDQLDRAFHGAAVLSGESARRSGPAERDQRQARRALGQQSKAISSVSAWAHEPSCHLETDGNALEYKVVRAHVANPGKEIE